MLGPLSLATVTIALPVIAIDLAASARIVSWIPTGFLLSSVIFMLPAGKFADIYGRKRVYLLGVISTGLISVAASFVQTAEWLLFWRFMQGFSMAVIFGTGLAILMSVYSGKHRGMAMGVYTGSVYFALTVSPVLGGLSTEYWGWRSVFWIQAPLSFVVVGMIVFTMPGEWRNAVKRKFDWTGSAIFAGWAATFVFGLSGLPDLSSIVTLLISVPYLGLFIWHQARVESPLISMTLFTNNRIFSFSLIASVLMYSVNFPLHFLLSIFLQIVNGLSPTYAGIIMVFQAFMMAIVAPIAGRVSDRIQPRIVATMGCLGCVLGFFIIWAVSSTGSNGLMALGLACVGIGFAFFTTPNNSAAMGAVEKKELGTASSAVNLARSLGNLVGMSLMALIIHSLIGDQTFSLELSDELVVSLQSWMWIAICLAGLASVFSLFRGRST